MKKTIKGVWCGSGCSGRRARTKVEKRIRKASKRIKHIKSF